MSGKRNKLQTHFQLKERRSSWVVDVLYVGSFRVGRIGEWRHRGRIARSLQRKGLFANVKSKVIHQQLLHIVHQIQQACLFVQRNSLKLILRHRYGYWNVFDVFPTVWSVQLMQRIQLERGGGVCFGIRSIQVYGCLTRTHHHGLGSHVGQQTSHCILERFVVGAVVSIQSQ